MKRRPIRHPLTWIALAAVAAGPLACGPARRDAPYTQALTPASDAVAHGQRVFMVHCHQCHPGGAAGLGPAINDKPLPGWLIKTQVRRGLGTMPAFKDSQIPDRDLDDLVAYLKALRSLEKPKAS